MNRTESYWSTLTEWVPRVLRDRCTVDHDASLNRRQRWWLTLKTLACLVFGREASSGWGWSGKPETIAVAYGPITRGVSYEYVGPTADWEQIDVGRAGRGSWFFIILWNGYP